jgi:hypothetical protein
VVLVGNAIGEFGKLSSKQEFRRGYGYGTYKR